MAGGVIDYNGYKIASGALDDNILNLLDQQGLLQDPMMSGPVPLQDQNSFQPTGLPQGSNVAGLMAGKGVDFLRDNIDSGGRSSYGGYELRAQRALTNDLLKPIEKSIEPVPSYAEPVQNQPIGSGVLAPEAPTSAVPVEQTQSAPVGGSSSAPAPKQYDPYADILAGRQKAGQAGVAGAQNEANVRGDIVDQGQAAIQRIQEIKDREQEELKPFYETQKKLAEEYRNGELKDPWATKSGGQKALAIFALALGGAGSALTKTPNYALSIINDEIDRDIALQKDNLNKTKGEIDINNNLLANLQKKFGDEKVAELEYQSLSRQMLNDKIDQTTAQTSSDVKKAQLQELKGMNTLLMEEAKDNSIKRKQELLKGGAEINSLLSKAGQPDDETLKKFVPGVGIAFTEKDATKIKEETAAVNQSVPLLDDLLKLNDKNFKSLSPKDRSMIDQTAANLIGKLRLAIVGPGPLTDTEREFIQNKIIGNPAAIFAFDDVNRAKLANLKRILNDSVARTIEAYGVVPFTSEQKAFSDKLVRGGASSGMQTDSGQTVKPQDPMLLQQRQAYSQRLAQNPNDSNAQEALRQIDEMLMKAQKQ